LLDHSYRRNQFPFGHGGKAAIWLESDLSDEPLRNPVIGIAWLLRARRERPRGRAAAEQSDELAAPHVRHGTCFHAVAPAHARRAKGRRAVVGANCSYIEVASPAFAYALMSQG
jgi:hypothetical protein